MYEFLLKRTDFDKRHDLLLPYQFSAAFSKIGRRQEEDFYN